jgi:hypothetical protein
MRLNCIIHSTDVGEEGIRRLAKAVERLMSQEKRATREEELIEV